MKNKSALIFFGLVSMIGIGIGVFLMTKKKSKTVSASIPEETNSETVKSPDKMVVKDPIIENKQPIIEEPVIELPKEPEKPWWYTNEMEMKYGELRAYYKNNSNYKSDYATWIKNWPGEEERVKDAEEYLIEKAIWDLEAVQKMIDANQAKELKKYYGIWY